MSIVLLIGLTVGYATWAGCLESFRTGRLPYAAGYNAFTLMHNALIAPIGLIKLFGLLYGIVAAIGAWFIVAPIILGVLPRMLLRHRPDLLLAAFGTMVWVNLGLVIASFVLL